MSKLTFFNIASTSGTGDGQQVRLCLLQALCNEVRNKRDTGSVGEILEQLIAYSEAHFMSEELLMRLSNYDDYENHADEHIHMLDMLNRIAADHAAGHCLSVSERAEEAFAFIGNHVVTRDRHFADHVRNGQ